MDSETLSLQKKRLICFICITASVLFICFCGIKKYSPLIATPGLLLAVIFINFFYSFDTQFLSKINELAISEKYPILKKDFFIKKKTYSFLAGIFLGLTIGSIINHSSNLSIAINIINVILWSANWYIQQIKSIKLEEEYSKNINKKL